MRKKNNLIAIICGAVAAVIIAVVVIVLINVNSNQGEPVTTGDIVVDTNAGVPYIWEIDIADPTIVQIVGQKSEQKDSSDVVGGPIETTYTFESLKEGETEIKLSYRHVSEGTITKVRRFIAKVSGNKNIKIEEISTEQDLNGESAKDDSTVTYDITEGNAEQAPAEESTAGEGADTTQSQE